MKMRSPIVAMLWENWRLTRVEAAVRLGLGIVAASAAMMLFDAGAKIAFGILLLVHCSFWFSIAKLNGGRFADGYKPGFPLYLLYTRPAPTAVIVGVAMAYDAISCVALYVASAALVGFAFGQPLPLLSVTVYLVTFHLACTCLNWSTRNRVVQFVASVAIIVPFFFLLVNRVASPLQVEFSVTENAVMALFGFVAFGFTVAGVARQRRGDAVAIEPRKAQSGGYSDWLVSLLRFPCPTSSARRAQLWFELRSSGLPVLAIGLLFSMLIALLFAISIPIAPVRPFAALSVMVSVPAALILGGNAFGIRRRQGRTYISAFEATQPYGDAQLAGLKILVRSACVLAALIAIGASVWASTSLVSAWGSWVVDGKSVDLEKLVMARRTFRDTIGGLSAYVHAAIAVVTSFSIALVVASHAAFTALRARYSRRVNIAGSLLLLYVFALVVFKWAAQRGIGSEYLLSAMLRATGWIAAAALVLGTAYLVWRAFAERLLTPRQGWGVVLVSAALGAAWVMVLRAAPMQFGGVARHAVWILSLALPPLMASVLAPWSLNRIRHI